MTTLEVTVLDDSKASFILSLLQEFRYISIGNVTKAKEQEGSLDFEKFDIETQNRIKAHFNAKKTDETQLTFSLEQLENHVV
jgi:DNA-binding helix-hairpin-helix protein with protein kinase domain